MWIPYSTRDVDVPVSLAACTKLPHGGALPSGVAAGAPSVDCGAGDAAHETDADELAGTDDTASGGEDLKRSVGADDTSGIGAAEPDPTDVGTTDVEPCADDGDGDEAGASAMPRPLPDPVCTVRAP